MHDPVTLADLKALLEAGDPPRVSIYVPTERAGRDARANPLRLRNALRDASAQLPDDSNVLADAHALTDEEHERWRNPTDGFALFAAPGLMRSFRLPIVVEPLTVVGERFHVKPLLPLIVGDGRFAVLALSQNDCRLFEATRFSIRSLAADELPTSLDDALGIDDPEKSLQFHTGTAPTGGRRAAIFHGHGAGNDDRVADIARYCRAVDDAVRRAIDSETPLVLAADRRLAAAYREVSEHPRVLDDGVDGNAEHLSADALHEAAWPVAKPAVTRHRRAAIERFAEIAHTPQASNRIEEIVKAGLQGRVDTLFVARGANLWGRVAADGTRVDIDGPQPSSPGAEDLVDRAAFEALTHGGAVHTIDAAEMPGLEHAAAVFRY